MDGNLNISPKISGAMLIGFAMVAGTYIITNFKQTKPVTQPTIVESDTSILRTSIAVSDENNNGIEDWKDELVSESEIIVSRPSTEEYIPPETVTGKAAVNLAEDVILSKTNEVFGLTNEEILTKNTDSLINQVEFEELSTSDTDILEDWEEDDLVNYANTAATVLFTYDDPTLDYEIDILEAIINQGDTTRISELESMALIFENYLNDFLKIPVPSVLAKEHLDLTNTFKALAEDIRGMMLAVEDPLLGLLYVRRHQDDALALVYSMQNMYDALEPYGNLFEANDPAVIFAAFGIKNQFIKDDSY